MQPISWNEKYSVLNIYSKPAVVMLSGMISGFVLCLCLSMIFYTAAALFVKDLMPVFMHISKICMVVFASLGIISSFIINKSIKSAWQDYGLYAYRDRITYWLFFLLILFVGYFKIFNMVTLKLTLPAYFLVLPFFVSLIFAGFLKYIWQILHCFVLSLLTNQNYVYLVNEKNVKDLLKLKISEARRYGGGFSVMALSLANEQEIIKKYGVRTLNRLVQDVVKCLEQNMRETDIFWQIANGRVIISIAQIGKKDIKTVSRRIEALVQEQTFIYGNRMITTSVKIGVGTYGKGMHTPEKMLQRALKEL